MKYDQDKVDEMTLALLYLVTTKGTEGIGARAGKAFDAATMTRLHEKGWINDPKTKSLFIQVTEEGLKDRKRYFGSISKKARFLR